MELAPLADADLLAQHVLAALGLREEPGQSSAGTLAAHLREQHRLLVLDNCEHLVGAAAALAEALLRTCPGLTVLATSREPLDPDPAARLLGAADALRQAIGTPVPAHEAADRNDTIAGCSAALGEAAFRAAFEAGAALSLPDAVRIALS